MRIPTLDDDEPATAIYARGCQSGCGSSLLARCCCSWVSLSLGCLLLLPPRHTSPPHLSSIARCPRRPDSTMPLLSATEATTALSTTTPDSPSNPRPRRRGRKTALSDKISHLVSRFEPQLAPSRSVPAEPLLSTTTPLVDDEADEDDLETAVHGGEAEREIAAGAAIPRDEDDLEAAGSSSQPLLDDPADDIKEKAQAGDGVESPAATSASLASRINSHGLETARRSDSLPAYGDTSHGDSRKLLSQYSPSRGTDEAEKGDLGYSDPFADVFAVDEFADPLLADSDLFRPTRNSPPPSQTPPSSPPPLTTRTVPLYQVFARNAEPLVLPGLDEAIDALGGAAHFTPMPTLETGCEISNVAKRASGETDRGDAFEMTATGDKLTRRSAEWQGWERWVRDGPPPSRWSRFINAVLPFSWRRRSGSTDPSLDEAARQAHLTTAQYKRSLILPPFHLLPPRVTVTDLKANRRRPAPLVTFQTVLKIVGNGILGAAGSSKGISLTTLEGLRDLMQ